MKPTKAELQERRAVLMLFAPSCICPQNFGRYSARLVEAVKPAQWECAGCRRTWTFEPDIGKFRNLGAAHG